MNARLLRLIRPMTLADVPAVAAIESAIQYHPWNTQQFMDSLAMGHPSWVLLQADRLVGFAMTMQVLDEATLLEFGVCPLHQRQGMGRQLLQWLVEVNAEAGMAVLHLEVRVGNVAARSLYRQQGFVEVGRRKAYYRAPITPQTPQGREDALLMALTLDEGAR